MTFHLAFLSRKKKSGQPITIERRVAEVQFCRNLVFSYFLFPGSAMSPQLKKKKGRRRHDDRAGNL